jgi:hypothetical protein
MVSTKRGMIINQMVTIISGLNCKGLTYAHSKVVKGGLPFWHSFLSQSSHYNSIDGLHSTTRNFHISSQNEAA